MPVFDLTASVTVSAITRVVADSLAEAIEIAKERSVTVDPLGRADRSEVWLIEEADGEPDDIVLA